MAVRCSALMITVGVLSWMTWGNLGIAGETQDLTQCVAQLVDQGVAPDQAAQACSGQLIPLPGGVTDCLTGLEGTGYSRADRSALCQRSGSAGSDCVRTLQGSGYSRETRLQICSQSPRTGAQCLRNLEGSGYSRQSRLLLCRQTGLSGAQCLRDLEGSSYSRTERLEICGSAH